jgi:prepilin-type N-terminal cleavage/methylation domain-containing protein
MIITKNIHKLKLNKTYQAGFSLIEMAVVLIVIGLIIGGVLKGQELIEAAKIKAVLTQLNEYRLAVSTFMERYDGLPGDFNQAKAYIKDSLKNGNHNGLIEGEGLAPDSEAGQFWQHLAAAELIAQPGVQEGQALGFGKGVPAARIGGGVTVTSHPYLDMPGNWFVLGSANGTRGNGALLTPFQAMNLDKKTDNGDPQSGRIRAFDGEGGEGHCLIEGRYNLENKKPACVLYFQF